MSVAIPIPLLQHLPDVNVTPAVGVDEYALTYDHGTASFVLRAPFAGILATGATVGATSQAQAFTLGVVSPFLAPAADSTTAWQVRKADKTTAVLNVDTTNGRVGIGTAAPGAALHVGSNAGYGTVEGLLVAPNLAGGVGIYNRAYQIAPVQTAEATGNSVLMYLIPTVSAGVTQTNQVGIVIDSKYATGGSVTNYAGLLIDYNNNNLGATNSANILMGQIAIPTGNYSIYDATGDKVYISGSLGIGTTTPATRLDIDAGALTMKEMTAPTGVADKAMLYTKDNGAGKTQLCAKLGDNVEIILATQA